jgi:hypothetical protein
LKVQDEDVLSLVRPSRVLLPVNRFIGIFDTVAAIGAPVNGLNPHSADTGDVKLTLRPGVAEKVCGRTGVNTPGMTRCCSVWRLKAKCASGFRTAHRWTIYQSNR